MPNWYTTLQMPGIAGEARLFKDGEFTLDGQEMRETEVLSEDEISFFAPRPPLPEMSDLSARYPDRPVAVTFLESGGRKFHTWVFFAGQLRYFAELDPGPEERATGFEEVTGKLRAAFEGGTITPGSVTVIVSRSGDARARIISAV